MSYQRIDRISEEVRHEVDRIIREEVSDPRVAGTFSITRAEVTRDLRYAKIYVSVLEDDKRDDLMKALKSAAGFIRRSLGKNMLIRYAPELQFISDQNIAYGVHIAKMLADAQTAASGGQEENE
ncbi:MAG: 30S ribosome-binding factor RbfA [Christensenellaceae bacterium]|nr:30S ribosome-binding factor RbfA [Christensenellaceae bacterium]